MAKPKLSLFLDRDGVLNRRLPGEYVDHFDRFHWTKGCIEALQKMSPSFDYIFIVTNQQGIGKGLMTAAQLDEIHARVMEELELHGVHIDQVYYCPDLNSVKDNCRKPRPTMGYWAKNDFPDLRFDRAVMFGDSHSDLQFARALGMVSVWIDGEIERKQNVRPEDYDFKYASLAEASTQMDEILYELWFS